MKILSLTLAIILTSAPNSMALQPENNIDYLFKLSLEELLKVKVTGSTLTPKELKTVPAAVTVFTDREIKNLGLDTLDELVNLVPGFQSYRSSFSSLGYQISSRGRRIGNSNSEILIMVDGMRLAGPSNGGSATIVPKYPLMQIERAEFIRGPGSAVYGANAMMGVINIITRSDVDEMAVSYGSFNRRTGHLLTSKKIGDLTIDLFGYFDMDEGDEYQVQDTFSANRIGTGDPRDLTGLNINLQWQNTHLNFQHNQSKVDDFYALDGLSNGFNERTTLLTALSLRKDLDWQAMASYVWLSHTRSKLTAAAQLTASGTFAANSNPASNDALFIRVDPDVNTETRLLWHNDWNINPQHSLQFGIELRHIKAPNTLANNNFDLGDLANGITPIRYYGSLLATTTVLKESRRDIVGLYGQYQQQVFDNTHLTLGLRRDDFSNIGSQFSPRFGLVQVLNDHHSLKLLYGEAFRAPTENELYLLNNPVLLGNPDLAAEKVQSIELIWVGQWFDSGISLGYFEANFKDAIVLIGSGVRKYENVDQDPSKGFELELSHELNNHWSLRGTYTDIIETPVLSFRESDQLASVMVNYQTSYWNANLFGSYHGMQEMPALDGNGERIRLDGFWLLSGKLKYATDPQWHAFLQIKNILNKDYSTPPSSADLTEGVPNRGREILTGLNWMF